MDIQVILDAIKDYGAAMISTISAGGIAAVVGLIAKIKAGTQDSKKYMEAVLAKKEEESKAMSDRYDCLTSQIKELTDELAAERERTAKFAEEVNTKKKK